jgi:galactokinase
VDYEGVWAAPGRINLIGEHTDYSGGLVLPMALPQVCQVAVARRDDGIVAVRSGQWPSDDAIEVPVEVKPGDVSGWAAYVLGVVWALRQARHAVPGADLTIDSQVPIGAGLSSSAAVGCSVALALTDLFGLDLDRPQMAAIAHRSENEFVGAPTGVMDQSASLLAEAGHLLFLDTATMDTEQVPFELETHRLVLLVIDTQTAHVLNDGNYGSRREAVEEGTRLLGVDHLGMIGIGELESALDGISSSGGSGEVMRRVRHVITENARVSQVVDMLEHGGDPRRVGPVLTAGHASLRDDFQVSTPELDAAVEAAAGAGAYGARMTGGGFGGSAIALVDAKGVNRVRAAVERAYTERGFTPARFFTAVPSAGARRVE